MENESEKKIVENNQSETIEENKPVESKEEPTKVEENKEKTKENPEYPQKKSHLGIMIFIFIVLVLITIYYFIFRPMSIEEITNLDLSDVYVKGSGFKETELLNNKYYKYKITSLLKDSSPDLDLDIDYDVYTYYDKEGNILFTITDKEDKLEVNVNGTLTKYEYSESKKHKYDTNILLPTPSGEIETLSTEVINDYSMNNLSWNYDKLESSYDKQNLNKKMTIKTDYMEFTLFDFKDEKTANTRFIREVQNLIGVEEGEEYDKTYIYKNTPSTNIMNLIAVKDNVLIILEEDQESINREHFRKIENTLANNDYWVIENGE